jgi:hypothetical protein
MIFESAMSIIEVDHISIDKARNPALAEAKHLGASALRYILVQYARFPRAIVDLLESARDNLGDWHGVPQELERNISEELGGGDPRNAHYRLLRQGLLDEFGVDIESCNTSIGTNSFLISMAGLVGHSQPAVAAGAAYSIEASAVGELSVVRAIADELSRRTFGRRIHTEGSLHIFLESHIAGFEIGHEEGLRRALEPHLRSTEQRNKHFLSGCRSVMQAMDNWWMSLASEARDR